MELKGEYKIAAPRERVWEALNDPDVLKRCIPGCEELEKVSPTELAAKVQAKVGPVKARFAGSVTLSDLDPPNGYKISGEGKGGAAGFAKGNAVVKLAEADGGTLLTYTAEALVGGKLAQIGQRLIGGTAKKLADEFFTNMAKEFGEAEGAAAAAQAPATGAPAPTVAPPSATERAAPAAEAPSKPATPPPAAAEAAKEGETVSKKGEEEMFEAAMRAASVGHTRPQAPSGALGEHRAEPGKRGGMSGLSKVALVVLAVLVLYALYLLL
jgi:carbon monoxide dehydrogenase subunit G